MAHKGEQIVQGDVEGNLHVFYLKARKYSVIATGRGAIKKICFAPGETNMKLLVLYNDGVMLLHLNEVSLILTETLFFTVSQAFYIISNISFSELKTCRTKMSKGHGFNN